MSFVKFLHTQGKQWLYQMFIAKRSVCLDITVLEDILQNTCLPLIKVHIQSCIFFFPKSGIVSCGLPNWDFVLYQEVVYLWLYTIFIVINNITMINIIVIYTIAIVVIIIIINN